MCDSCGQNKITSAVRGGLLNLFISHPSTRHLRNLCHKCMQEWREARRKIQFDPQLSIIKHKKNMEERHAISQTRIPEVVEQPQ